MKLSEKAVKEAIRASVEDFPKAESPVVFELYGRGFDAGFKEAIALAAEKSEEMGRHVKGGYNNAAAQIADEIRALAEPEAPRCKHGVHGNDCFKCYPTTPPGACLW